MQSLVAFHLGKGDRPAAAAVFRRTLSLALFAGVVIMCGLLAGRAGLPSIFTQDAAVVLQVAAVSRGEAPRRIWPCCAACKLCGRLQFCGQLLSLHYTSKQG